MSQVDDAVQKLQNMWYNAFVTGTGMDASSFVFLQSGTQLDYKTSGLWQIIDAIPPKALTTVLSFGALNSFYQDYGALTSCIIAPVSDDFKRAMGDALDKWNNYKATVTPKQLNDAGGWVELFKFWAGQNLDPGKQAAAISAYQKDTRNIVVQSSDKYSKNSNPYDPFNPDKDTLYNITIDDITGGQIAHFPQKTFTMDSQTTSSDVTKTWAGGGISGFWDIFSGGASGSYSKYTSKFTSSRVTVNATFQRVGAIETFKPGNWYNSAFLNYAYKTKDNTVWSAGNPITWDSTFGEKGNMKRVIEELVLVDGIDITVTSYSSYSSEDQTEIRASARVGIWPFFSVSANGGYSSDIRFDDSGAMKVRTTCPLGNPAIFGANVRPIEQYLG